MSKSEICLNLRSVAQKQNIGVLENNPLWNTRAYYCCGILCHSTRILLPRNTLPLDQNTTRPGYCATQPEYYCCGVLSHSTRILLCGILWCHSTSFAVWNKSDSEPGEHLRFAPTTLVNISEIQ